MTATIAPPVTGLAAPQLVEHPGWGAGVLDDLDALVPPAFWHAPDYVVTIGDEVSDLCAEIGYAPNPEQRLLHQAGFGMEHTGRLAAFEIVVIAARQNLKTGAMIQRAIGKALLLKRPMQIWTAHKESATDQAHAIFEQLAEESAAFSRRVKSMPAGKGSKAVEFVNGCTIVFRPRTGKAGQSMSADDVDLDEYFAAEAKHEGSLVPTLSTRPNAQIGKFTSAPHAGSAMQRAAMARGRAAALGLAHEPRLLYAEWSVMRRDGTTLAGKPRYAPIPCLRVDCTHELGAEGCIADNREVIKLANPSAGRSTAPSITFDFIAGERRSLANPEAPADALTEWLKERLSIGVEDTDGATTTIFGPATTWTAGRRGLEAAPDEVGALGIAMSADREWIGLTASTLIEVAEDEDPEAEPVEVLLVAPVLHTTDRAAAIAEAKRIQDKHDCVVALDEGGPAATLLDDLEAEDVAVETLTLKQVAKACGDFHDSVTKQAPHQIVYLANTDLDTQVAAAGWRWVGDHRVIGRRDGQEAVDTTLLEAAVIAADQAADGGTTTLG